MPQTDASPSAASWRRAPSVVRRFDPIIARMRAMPRSSQYRTAAACAIAVIAFVPRALTVGHFETNDEQGWIARSQRFGDAIVHLHPSKASATTGPLATMPGVTTMWLGTAAHVVWWFGKHIGVIAGGVPFAKSASGLTLAELFVAIATSLILALFVELTWRWIGPIPAVVGALIMATEPFFVAHGSVLHVDELTAFFGVTGTVAFLLALDVPRARVKPPRRMDVLAGVLLACAFLSKVSAVGMVPGLLIVVVAVARGRQIGRDTPHPWLAGLADMGKRIRWMVLTAIVTVVALWPALWADPFKQIRLLVKSANQADTQHLTFFLGHPTPTPGGLYYLVAAPLRMTPWFLVGAVVFGVIALWGSPHARLIVLIAFPQAFVISIASKQFDRYSLPVLAMVALVAGIGVDVAWRALRARVDFPTRLGLLVAVPLAIVMFVNTVVVAPWGLAYFNPLLGGSSEAQHAVLVGWGEGLERAGAVITAREKPACAETVAVLYELFKAFPCGHLVTRGRPADYLVIYINDRQRVGAAALAQMRAHGRLIATIRIRGLDYAEVYDTRSTAKP